MTEYLKLKRVAWKDLLDGAEYLFKYKGGLWMKGMYRRDRDLILAGSDGMYAEGEIDNGILYELPEEMGPEGDVRKG
jgi:hypothetical protein